MIPWFELPARPLSPVPLDVPSLLALAGVGAGGWLTRHQARAAGLDGRRAVDGYFVAMAAALLCGHWADLLLYRRGELAADPWLALPWGPGYASVGAFLGAAAALWAWHRPSLATLGRGATPEDNGWRQVDTLAAPLALALGLTRVGCFLGHHHAGRLSALPFAVAYPGGARHDLGLHEAAGVLALLALLAWPGLRRGAPGTRVALGAIGYGVVRFLVEALRGDDLERIGRRSDPRYFGLTLAQYLALALLAAGVAALVVIRRRARALPR